MGSGAAEVLSLGGSDLLFRGASFAELQANKRLSAEVLNGGLSLGRASLPDLKRHADALEEGESVEMRAAIGRWPRRHRARSNSLSRGRWIPFPRSCFRRCNRSNRQKRDAIKVVWPYARRHGA